MLYRSPGKAKKGSCMFIRKGLYNKAHKFLTMGIKIPKKNSPIVEIGAYQSLITSSIEGKVTIPPENILVLKDVDSFFNTNVISIEIDKNKHCKSVPKENYEVLVLLPLSLYVHHSNHIHHPDSESFHPLGEYI